MQSLRLTFRILHALALSTYPSPSSCHPIIFGCQAVWSAHLYLATRIPQPWHLCVIYGNILSSYITFRFPPTPPHPTDCPTPSSSLLFVFLTPSPRLSINHIDTFPCITDMCTDTLHTLYFIPKYMYILVAQNMFVEWINQIEGDKLPVNFKMPHLTYSCKGSSNNFPLKWLTNSH